jgi:hypothetical protein
MTREMDRHPQLTALLRAQGTARQALAPFAALLALLGAWFVLGLISLAVSLDSGLMRVGLIAPLPALLVLFFAFLSRSGDGARARAAEALLARPGALRRIAITETRHRAAKRSWLIVDGHDGTHVELLIFSHDPTALREELARVFPEAASAPDAPTAANDSTASPEPHRAAPTAARVTPAPVVQPTQPTGPAQPTRPAPERIRLPHELVAVDAASRTIELSVVIVGGGAKRFARALLPGDVPSSEPERPGELEHRVVRLGAIRGWATSLFVYALDDSLDAITRVAPSLVAAATAVVLVQSSPESARLDPALFPMAKLAESGSKTLAFVGSESARAELARDAGTAPHVTGHDAAAAPLVLKELTKRLLAQLRTA